MSWQQNLTRWAFGMSLVLGTLGTTPFSYGQTYVPTTGSTNWNTGANWSTNPLFPNGIGASATFASVTGTLTSQMTVPITVGSIDITNNHASAIFTISASGANTLTMDASSGNATITVNGTNPTTNNVTISAATVLADTLVFTVNNTAGTGAATSTMTGVVSGAGGFTKDGAGRFTFSTAAKTYTGATTVNQGRLRYTATGVSSHTSSVLVNSGGMLMLDQNGGAFDFGGSGAGGSAIITINGAGTTESTGNLGALRKENSGTTTLANAVTLGSDATIHVNTAGAVLQINGAVSGASQLTKTGAGTLTFTNANAGYTGSTFIAEGVLTINSGSAMGTGALKMGDDAGSASVTLNLNNAAQSIGSLSQGTASVTRDINLGTNHALSITQTAAGTYSGTIDGATGSLTLTSGSTNTLTLDGANSSYGGATTINGGTLAVGTLNNGGANSSIGAASSVAGNLVINGGVLRYIGAVGNSNRLFSIGASGGTIESSGTGALGLNGVGAMGFVGGAGARTLTLGGTNTLINTLDVAIGDNGIDATSLVKSGPGTWLLTNANTYSGGTVIQGGTLLIGNALGSATGSGPVTVGASGTLGGVGSLSGAVTVQGVLAPGNSVGDISLGATTLTANSEYAWEVSSTNGLATPAGYFDGGSGLPGTHHDQATISGTLDFAGVTTFSIASIDNTTGAPAALGGFVNSNVYSWIVATTTGGITGLSNVTIDDSAFITSNGSLGSGIFFLTAVGNNLVLTFSPVPEPTSIFACLAGFGLVSGLIWRRRSQSKNKKRT